MAAGNYTFTIEQGATTDFEIQWADAAGTAIDLTGYVAKMSLKSAIGGTAYLSISSSLSDAPAKAASRGHISLSGSSHTMPLSSGSIGVYIGHTVTAGLTSEAVYDLELTSGAAKTRLLQGKVRLSKEVTTV
jgi:hypothetical protein|tara:strand:+ start:1005 stop:1400 length:396 start_codon:yes stop_codon:yes gene_type:complete